jgi:hypothetical protein
MGGEELCWFFIITCGPIGVVESVVGKMIFFSYWNMKKGYSMNKWDMMDFVLEVFLCFFTCK